MLSSDQVRAARALLRWDQSDLADASGVSIETVKRLEKIDGQLSATRVSTIEALLDAIEGAGVVFDLEAGTGAGVRFKDSEKPARPHDHPEPSGPATDVIRRMEAEICEDHKKRKPKR